MQNASFELEASLYKKNPKISHSLLIDYSLVSASLPLCSLAHSLSVSPLLLPKNP